MNANHPTDASRSRGLLLCAFTAAGVAANHWQVALLPGTYFSFGSVFALVTLQVLGIGRSTVAAAVIAGSSQLFMQYPASIGVMALEVIVVGLLTGRRRMGMILADALFWLSLGFPLLFLLYQHTSHLSGATSLFKASTLAVSAVVNAVLARTVLTSQGPWRKRPLIPLRDIIFNKLDLLILCPVFVLCVLACRIPASLASEPLGHEKVALALFLVLLVGSALVAEVLSARLIALLEYFSKVTEPPVGWSPRVARPDGPETRIEEACNLMQNYRSIAESHRSLYLQINRLNATLEQRITERTNELVQNQAFTLNVLDSLLSSIAVLDSQGVIVVVNERWRVFADDHGVPKSAAAFLGENYLEVCRHSAEVEGGGYAAATLAGLRAVLEGEQDQFLLEYPCRAPEETLWFALRVTKLTGPRSGAVVSHTDITCHKKAEKALRESEEKHRLLFDHAGDAILVLEPRGRLLAANRQACERLCYPRDQLLSMTLDQLHPPQEAAAWQGQWRRLAERGHLLYETRHLRSDGRQVPAEVSARLVSWDGEPALLTIWRDLTERKQLEDEMRQALEAAQCASANMKRLLRTVSHEFRTPLGLLTCGVDILDRYWEKLQPEARLQHHATIRHAAQQLTVLVGSVTAFNQAQTAPGQDARQVEVATLCQSIASDVAVVWGGAHRFEASIEECGWALLDESLVRRVLENLLTNAFRFTPAGGAVRLQVARDGDLLRLGVADSGIGIPEQDHERVFEAFYRSHNVEERRGLGLGLSIVKEALTRMGGSIRVQSGVQAGCTMAVEIPLHE